MDLHQLKPSKGARQSRKRVGRGDSSGVGTQSGRGTKGQKSRSGGGVRPGFEGGQLPLVKRMPFKRGFHNPFRVSYQVVNVGILAAVEAGTIVDPAFLKDRRLIRHADAPVKILGTGVIGVALKFEGVRATANAKQKIEAAGGSLEEKG